MQNNQREIPEIKRGIDLYRNIENNKRFELRYHNTESLFYTEYYVYELFKDNEMILAGNDNITRSVRKLLYCKIRIKNDTKDTVLSKFYYEY